jgi:trimethylamine:corrinoid methyltransferase-like protein
MRNDSVTVPENTATQLTNANAAAIRVHADPRSCSVEVELQATAGATAPASWAGSVVLRPGETLAADLTIAQLWPGVTGANRVWARSLRSGVSLSVSHADA